MEQVIGLAKSNIYGNDQHELFVVEDLAEAHGVIPHPDTDAACWSFYKNKIVGGEEGGAVAFKNPEHARLARRLRSLGFNDEHDFNHYPRGHNYRMSNAHAKLIIGSLNYYPVAIQKRREVERLYEEACPVAWRQPERDVPWVYDLRIRGMSSEIQDRVVRGSNKEGITARHCFKPMTRQLEYREGIPRLVENNADRLSREVIYLPIRPGMKRIDCAQPFEIIQSVLGKCSR